MIHARFEERLLSFPVISSTIHQIFFFLSFRLGPPQTEASEKHSSLLQLLCFHCVAAFSLSTCCIDVERISEIPTVLHLSKDPT